MGEVKAFHVTPSTKCLFLHHLETCTEAELRDAFSRFGELERVSLCQHRRIAFVAFVDANHASNAWSHWRELTLSSSSQSMKWRVDFAHSDEAPRKLKREQQNRRQKTAARKQREKRRALGISPPIAPWAQPSPLAKDVKGIEHAE